MEVTNTKKKLILVSIAAMAIVLYVVPTSAFPGLNPVTASVEVNGNNRNSISQENNCEDDGDEYGTVCTNDATITDGDDTVAVEVGSGTGDVEVNDNNVNEIDQENECSGDAECTNLADITDGDDSVTYVGSGEYDVEVNDNNRNEIDQENECSDDAECTNDATITDGDDSVDVEVDEGGSGERNSGENYPKHDKKDKNNNNDDGDTEVNDNNRNEIEQENECSGSSTCSNDASIEDGDDSVDVSED